MRTTIIQQKKYSTGKGSYQLFLPLEYEVIIPENDSVRFLSQIMDELAYSELYAAYSQEGRKPATEPKILTKVMIYAYMEFIYSTRKIEKACHRDINFMWLLNGERVPDHSTISRFRKDRLGAAVEGLFYQFIEKLCEMGEVKYEDVFIDGTKIEAASNRYTFVWKKAVEKNEAKMLLKVQALAEEILKAYLVEFTARKETINEDMAKMALFLEQKKQEEKIEFVYGSGKRKSNVQKLLEALYSYQERQKGYDESNKTFNGRNSYSKTDKDATFMRMKDDHMRNGQLKPAYNVQLAVETEYVVGVGVFQNPGDTVTLKPMLENMYEHTKMLIKRLIADSGYESEENYTYLESKGIIGYIKPQTYEQQKKRNFKKNISKRENMSCSEIIRNRSRGQFCLRQNFFLSRQNRPKTQVLRFRRSGKRSLRLLLLLVPLCRDRFSLISLYNAETDEYTCHNGKQLKVINTFHKKSKTGYISEVTQYECESCEGCPHKEKCTKAKGNRRMEVSKAFIEKRQKSYENITTRRGVLLRMNRSIQAEGAFGVLKEDRQFDRFLTRGSPNVKTELLLLCFGYVSVK